jgi:tRNA 2-thiouridine synthesizing protein D
LEETLKTLTIILTDGPYISEYAEVAYKLAVTALKQYKVNIFLYLDAVHILKKGQDPSFFTNVGKLFLELAEKGVIIRACARCAVARGYIAEKDVLKVEDLSYSSRIEISSIYELSEMISKSDRVISLSR